MREVVDAIYVLDPEWGNAISSSAKVPQMKLDREIHEQADTKNPVVPDVTGLGLKDAMFIIENSGLRCRYTGTGHVISQTPFAGAKATEGSAITLTLK